MQRYGSDVLDSPLLRMPQVGFVTPDDPRWHTPLAAMEQELVADSLVFEKMLTYGNHLGLYAEGIGSTGVQLGNFPQAFTHLAFIDAAITLDSSPGSPK